MKQDTGRIQGNDETRYRENTRKYPKGPKGFLGVGEKLGHGVAPLRPIEFSNASLVC